MWVLLISVQLMEFVWVALNLLRVERTATEPAVASVSDIHLAYMSYSHSVLTMLGAALGAWVVLAVILGRCELGLAVAVGIASHLKKVKLSDLRGQKVVVSFHPLAFTNVCTRQMLDLELNQDKLKEVGATAAQSWPSEVS
jgi:hypothetical protein